MRHTFLCLMLAGTLVAGCGGDDETREEEEGKGSVLDSYPPIDLTPGNIAAFATASAPNIFAVGIVLLVVPGIENDPLCPRVTESATETVYEGGCTTMDGTNVVGKAIVTETPEGDGTIQYLGWGLSEAGECQGAPVATVVSYTGLMTFDKTAVGAGAFDLEIVVQSEATDPESCATFSGTAAYDYAGSFAGSESAEGNLDMEQPTTWNGSGQVGSSLLGKLTTTTENEIVDGGVCDYEAVSGTTTLQSGPDTAVITYDGLSDCDMESTVQWSLNGVDQGELSDVRCSTSSPGRRGGWLGLGLALGLLRRRRRG